MIQTLIGPVADLVGGYFQRKAEEKKAVHEAKMVAIQQDGNWENIHANNAANSWKDEWFTLLFSIPCVLAFFPSMVPIVMDGFAVLEAMPEWYKAFLGAAVAASFGLRGLANWKKQKEYAVAQTFTFFKGAEKGKGNPNYLYEQRGLNEEATVEDLQEYFESTNRLQEQFGSFDNYLSYMTEREQLIQSGDYDVGNWAEADAGFTEDQQMIFEGDADLTIDPSDPGQSLTNLRRQQSGAQSGAYENWVNSDANQALLQKYGISDTVYSETGDKFRWNGSAYVKTQDEDKVTLGDYAKMAMGVAMGYYAGPALGEALTGASGAAAGTATGSAVTTAGGATVGAAGGTAAATTAGSFLQGAINSTLGSAISQGIATGSVDARQLATAGIMGGVGGVADAIKAGELTGTAASNAINELATTTGLSVAETTNIVEGVINGTVTGSDIEDIALGAVQGYTSGQIKNALSNILGDEVEIPNVFDDKTTTIPIESLSPFIDTAVNAAFEGNLETTDVLGAIGDYLDEGGSLSFLDPTRAFDLDAELFGLPESLREIGRETEDFVRDVVRPIGQAADYIKEQLPHGETPEFATITGPDLPSIDTPDLPRLSLGGGMLGGGGVVGVADKDPKLSYESPGIVEALGGGSQQNLALQQLTELIQRSSKPPRGMLA